jgi:hypothetical protein
MEERVVLAVVWRWRIDVNIWERGSEGDDDEEEEEEDDDGLKEGFDWEEDDEKEGEGEREV